MSDFDKAAELVLKQEGGYSNNPRDPGGETLYGISKRFHPEVDFATLTPEGAKAIYRTDYWEEDWLELPQNMADLLLSLAVNMGRGATTSLAQKALGIIPTANWGGITHHAALVTPQAALLVAAQAIKVYESKDQPDFINGWVKRVLEALCHDA